MIQAIWTEDTESQIYRDSIAIRWEIFIEEQGYPNHSEIDGLEEHTVHLVLYDEAGEPVATTRIYEEAPETYRIERVAVRKTARGRGLGRRLIEEAEAKIAALGGKTITLKSEDTAIEFYKKFGYTPAGDEIIEHDFSHQGMVKKL